MKQHLARITGAAFLLGAFVTGVFAGGPLLTYDFANKTPYVWNMQSWPGGAVPVYTDLGNLKNANPLISNTRANELAVNGWNQWNAVPTSSFLAQVVGDFSLLGLGDINRNSALQVINTFNGGGIHVIYDTDGTIMSQVLGISGALGVANLEFAAVGSPELLEAWVVLNGNTVRTNDPSGLGFAGVFTHEFGHAVNLAHSQANGAILSFFDAVQPRNCAAPWSGSPVASQIETMYPFTTPTPTGTGAFMASVERLDDTAAISNLYPEAGWPASHGSIRGKVVLADGTTGVTAVNVIARNIADPFNDFTSYLSGQVSKGQAGPDGSFELNGLTPGAQYALYLDNLVSGAFSVPRLIVLPGAEEYYNGQESGNGLTDDRCAWTPITATPGAPVVADVAFNEVRGAPVFRMLPLNAIPTDMTPDGRMLVGNIGAQVWKWTESDGFQNIGGEMNAGEVAVSNDGSRISGTAKNPATNNLHWAIYENGAWTLLPPHPASTITCSGTWGAPYDMSGDGRVLVGGSWTAGCATAGFDATVWTVGEGMRSLPKSPDSPTRANRANAANYDGSVIVGWDDHTTGFRRGAYWLNESEIRVISTDVNTLAVGEALGLTSDGSTIVGTNWNAAGPHAAWRLNTATGQQTLLSDNTNDRNGAAGFVNENTDVILGWVNLFPSGRVPTIWTPQLGWANLNIFMESQGVYAEGIGIGNATALSADGRMIAGFAASIAGNTGWMLNVENAMICHRDPGVPGQPTTTIHVGFPEGLDEHLAHGDTVGLCQHGGP